MFHGTATAGPRPDYWHGGKVRMWGMSGFVRAMVSGLAIAAWLHAPLAAATPRQEDKVSQKLGRTVADSDPPLWPSTPQAPAGAPNVLLIMTDDVGFGASSTFGGAIPTPTLDALARDGLRYNQFNTAALCSPTRAALLTGRNPHRIGMGRATNIPTGYPGYTTFLDSSAGTIAEILKRSGYNTAMFGKSHLTPEWEMSQAGPFDRWPTGLGFEYFYGFLSADVSLWNPVLYENNVPVTLAKDPGYHLDRDLADRTIRWIRGQKAVAPDKPFFLYYAPGTAHTPHHAPAEWLERFRGKFDQGWDRMREEVFARQKAEAIIPANARLTPRPDGIPAWSSLNADQKRLYSRLMEAYAASLAYTDHEIGRVIDALREAGELDNTLVIFIQGDNGGSVEGGENGMLFEQTMTSGAGSEDLAYQLSRIDEIGGPALYNHFPAGWGWAINAPFRWYKQTASHFGGTRNGLVISWPEKIKAAGEIRSQFHYVTDIMPTILEAAQVEAPAVLNGVEQMSLDGVSLTYSFSRPDAPSTRRTQVFEMMENFSIYHDGWVAASLPQDVPWTPITQRRRTPLEERSWALYNVREDFSQNNDLAAANPSKLREMQKLFREEAARNKILPIHSFTQGVEGRPSLGRDRTVFHYTAGITHIPEDAAPHTIGRSYQITADIIVPQNANGVLVTQGGRFGGYAFYLKDGRPVFHYNAVGQNQYMIRAAQALPAGPHKLVAEFQTDAPKRGAPGTLTISANGTEIARGRIGRTISGWMSHTEGFDVGEDTTTPVNDDYDIESSKFSGKINSLIFNIIK